MKTFDFKKDRFFVYDFETEGLNQGFTRPWDVAWTLFEGGKVVESKQYYLKLKNPKISKGAADATGYEEKKKDIQEKGLPAQEVLEIFDKMLYDPDTYNVGHNILGYDSQIHNALRVSLGMVTDFSFIPRSIDTNAIARGIKMKKLPQKHENFTAWQYKILDARVKGLKTKIGILCSEYGIPYEESSLHVASYDVEKNVEIFKRQLREIEIVI